MSNYEFGEPQNTGDLCTVCRMDLAMEGDDVCASCAQELEPIIDRDPGDESEAA